MSEELRRRDAEARRLAQSGFGRPLVLEAGAGTGKTATLVARVVTWCLGPGWERAAEDVEGEEAVARLALEGVTAITFTEAAASEMAERVALAFAALERGDAVPKGLSLDLLEPREAAARRDRARALLSALDRLNVRTIHAFCLRLLAEHPFEAGLPPRFEVDADSSALQEIARTVVEEELREDSPARAALLELAVRDVQPEAVVDAVVRLVQAGVPPEELARERFPDERLAALQATLRKGIADFQAVDSGRLRSLPARAVAHRALDELESLARALSGAELGRGELAELVAARSAERKRLAAWAEGSFLKGEGERLGEDAAAASSALAPAFEALDELVRARLPVLDAARRALAPFAETARARLHSSGFVSYADLLRLARDLLAGHPAVRRREAGRMRQLLVDEFQDTDRVQCELVALLALPEDESAPAPGLFLVGDPKQSIYSWRRADLAAYDDFKARVIARGGEAHPLHVNFRSVPAVLEEVERLVKPVMHEEARLQPRFEKLLACEGLAGEAGFRERGRAPVEHWDCRAWEPASEDGAASRPAPKTATQRGAALEAETIARDVAELHLESGVPCGDFAILLRTSTHQEAFLDALRRRNIPFEVGKDRSYYRRREVIDAGAFVRAVLDPHDHLALLTWLRSPSVGVPDAALLPLWAAGFPEACTGLAAPGDAPAMELQGLVSAAAAQLPDDLPGLAALEGWEESAGFALEALAALRQSAETLPPEEFVEQLRTASALEAIEAARWLGSYRTANLDRFFRELEEEWLDPATTRHDVLRRLRRAVSEEHDAEEGRPRQEQPDAVQVMSIHAAKGLEFGHVYLPRLDNKGKEGRVDDTAAARVDGGWELRLFRAETPGWRDAARQGLRTERAERVRLLYVAATRARHRLVSSSLRWDAADPDAAKVLSDLLGHRDGGLADWEEGAGRAGTDAFGRAAWSEAGATWSVCALAEPEEELRRVEPLAPSRLPEAADAAAASQRLLERRARAALRSARPLVAAASEAEGPSAPAEHHEERAELLLGGSEEMPTEDREGEGTGEWASTRRPPGRGAARAAGTAVHQALERLDLAEGPEAFEACASLALERARTLAGARGAEEAERAARELLERVAAGACLARLRALGPAGVLARELPLVLAPPDDGPALAGLVGAIDLVYRDPENGEIVVADYKTDRVESEDAIAAALARHAPQLEVYRRGVARALRLAAPPRAELWLLWPSRIVELPAP